tara:strand:- start:349 stop:576 length:228 start_codon:yes stop_codon:yes gene_type:complete
MITNQKIEVGDVEYSKLSHVLRFTVAANSDAIRSVEDICGRTNMTMEEITVEMGKLLQTAIQMNYHRGGMRIKYD